MLLQKLKTKKKRKHIGIKGESKGMTEERLYHIISMKHMKIVFSI